MKYLPLLLILFALGIHAQSPKIFGHKFQRVYYVGECAEYDTISDSAYIKFNSEKEAEEKGYKKSEKCTILEKPKDVLTGVVGAYGDKSNKTYYSHQCDKYFVKVENRIEFDSTVSAEKAGYKLAPDCYDKSKEEDPPTPKDSKTAKQSPPKQPKLGKKLAAYNILSILTYTNTWYGRPIELDAYIRFNNDPLQSEAYAPYVLRDRSGVMYLHIPEGKANETLKKAIVLNDGEEIRGIFTVILSRELTERTNRAIAIISSFRLTPEKE